MFHPDDNQLREFAAGRLDDAEDERIEKHLKSCPDCLRKVTRFERSLANPLLNDVKKGLADSTENSDDEADEHPVPLPKTIGNYTIQEILGSGGMGTVYRAVNPHLNRPAAIKVVKPSRSMRKSSVERFQRELIANGKLRHDNIVDAFDAGIFENRPYLVMELLEGTDLSKYVQENGPLSVKEACEIIRQAALGLQCAHANGLVHRDIKPSNLFRTKDGKVKILDLGLARLLDTENIESDQIVPSSPNATSEGQILGSPDYMSPEQAVNAKNVDHRSDLYSLGCTFFYLLTGTPPFGESTELLAKIDAHAKNDLPPLKNFRKDVPPVIENLLRKMTAKKPEDRPGSAKEVEKVLERYLNPSRKRFVLVAVILLFFLATVGIYGFVQPKPKPIILPPERGEIVVSTQIPVESHSDILPEKNNIEKLGKKYGGWKLEHSLPGTMGDLNSAFFIFDGREVFDVQSSGIFQRWFVNGSRSEQMKINFPITAFALSHDRTTFAYACKIEPKSVSAQRKERWCIWVSNVKTGKALHSINPVSTKGPITTLAFSLDKKRIFIGGSGAEVWELPVITTGHSVMPDGTKSETKTYQRGNLRAMLRLPEEVGTVLAAAFSPDGKDVLFGNDKNFLFRYSSDENIERETPRKLTDMASCMKYGNDFRRLYIANETECIYVFSWDNESGLVHREEDDLVHPRQHARILTLALSPDNERLLFGGPNTFGIWNLSTKKIETSLPVSTDESIIALDYTPDGKTFLAREKENGKIQLWKNDSATSAAVPILKIPEQAPLPALSAVKPSKKLPDVWSPPPFRSSK